MNILPTGCQTNDCTGIAPDAAAYSLQDALYFNGTPITVIVTCPQGATCLPGSYPPTITYPRGRFFIPNIPLIPGQPIILSLQGCQSLVSVTLPAGSSPALIQSTVDSIIAQVAAQQAQCDSFPNFPFGSTISLTDLDTFACIGSDYEESIAAITTGGLPVSFSLTGGSLPTGLAIGTISPVEVAIIGTPTTVGTYNFTITATAFDGVTTSRGYTVTVGGITTTSPLAATIDEIFSETLAVSGMSGTLIWGIAAGSLPIGLALNTATGEITGVPTTLGSSSFTVFVQNDTQQCFKSFEMTVSEAVAGCDVFLSATWDAPELNPGNGSASASAAANVFNLDASCSPFTPFDPDQVAAASITGSITYTGPEVICNLHVVITKADWSFCSFNFNGVEIGAIAPGDTSGSYDFPITIPESVGIVYTIGAFSQAGFFVGGDGGSLSLTGTFGAPP